MSKIVCDFNGTSYNIRVEYVGEVYFKVDTGAAHTVIGLDLFHALMGISKRRILEFITNSNVPKMTFKTYSGERFEAVLCRLRNVKLSGVLIPEFYFYVTTASVNHYGLLGMDFISRCKIEGNPNQVLYLDKILPDKQYAISIYLDELSITERSDFDSAMDILSGR